MDDKTAAVNTTDDQSINYATQGTHPSTLPHLPIREYATATAQSLPRFEMRHAKLEVSGRRSKDEVRKQGAFFFPRTLDPGDPDVCCMHLRGEADKYLSCKTS